MPYDTYIDATAIALLALDGRQTQPGVRDSLAWLVTRTSGCRSPYSLAWGILALAAYKDISREVNELLDRTIRELMALLDSASGSDDICTLAICALALDAAEGDNVFEVRR